MSLDLSVSKNILQIGETKISKSEFIHNLSKSKYISAIEEKAIVSCFAKMLHFYFGTQDRKVFLQLKKRLLFHAL